MIGIREGGRGVPRCSCRARGADVAAASPGPPPAVISTALGTHGESLGRLSKDYKLDAETDRVVHSGAPAS